MDYGPWAQPELRSHCGSPPELRGSSSGRSRNMGWAADAHSWTAAGSGTDDSCICRPCGDCCNVRCSDHLAGQQAVRCLSETSHQEDQKISGRNQLEQKEVKQHLRSPLEVPRPRVGGFFFTIAFISFLLKLILRSERWWRWLTTILSLRILPTSVRPILSKTKNNLAPYG